MSLTPALILPPTSLAFAASGVLSVSLYFADYSHWHVRQVVVVSDLTSQNKAAQPVLVEGFGDRGAYLKYEASSSVRFRVHQVHSDDGDREGWAPPPMLTALFFD